MLRASVPSSMQARSRASAGLLELREELFLLGLELALGEHAGALQLAELLQHRHDLVLRLTLRALLTAHHHAAHLVRHREAHPDAGTLEARAGASALLHSLGRAHHHLGLGELLIA